MKTRSDEYKTNLVNDFKVTALDGFANKIFRPIIYKTFDCDWSSV